MMGGTGRRVHRGDFFFMANRRGRFKIGAMSEIRKSIEIQVPPDEVFKVISDLATWPRHLPHYRWIRVMENHPDHQIVRMACYRGWLPIDWVVRVQTDLAKRQLRFIHLHAISRGLEVVWLVEPLGDDTMSQVTVTSNIGPLHARWGGGVVKWVIQHFFVDYEIPYAIRSFAQYFADRSRMRPRTSSSGDQQTGGAA